MVLAPGDIVLLDNFSTITGSNFSASDFDDKKFMVTSTPTNLTITITMPSQMKQDQVLQHLVVLEFNLIIQLDQQNSYQVLVGV
jgi:hypothetical protein